MSFMGDVEGLVKSAVDKITRLSDDLKNDLEAGKSRFHQSHPREDPFGFRHLLLYSFGTDADIIATFSGATGYAIKTAKQDYRFTADISVGVDADLEIDAFSSAGIWRKSPREMKGAFLAVEACAADGLGVSVAAIFDFPDMSLIGFVFALVAGEGVDIDTHLGYTMTWQ